MNHLIKHLVINSITYWMNWNKINYFGTNLGSSNFLADRSETRAVSVRGARGACGHASATIADRVHGAFGPPGRRVTGAVFILGAGQIAVRHVVRPAREVVRPVRLGIGHAWDHPITKSRFWSSEENVFVVIIIISIFLLINQKKSKF